MKKRILVGLSGGLDSTVSALLLKQAGYEVIGVHFLLWHDPKAPKMEKNLPENKCCNVRDLMLARTVAKKLDIPFFTFDFRERFYTSVVADFLRRFSDGVTPNPCIECNRHIKFGVFLEKMRELGCDAVATGHFVQNAWNEEMKRWEMRSGKDPKKDQTYFLYTLTQKRLSHILFPMGERTKEEGRGIARENGFEVFAEKQESQGVCFFPEKNHIAFLQRHFSQGFFPGDIQDFRTGEVLGRHEGILHFTLGQRARIAGSLTRKFVIKTDKDQNIVFVGEDEDLFSEKVSIKMLSWTLGEPPKNGQEVSVRVRHGGKKEKGRFFLKEEGEGEIIFNESVRALTPGQSAVLYDDELVLGGGIMY